MASEGRASRVRMSWPWNEQANPAAIFECLCILRQYLSTCWYRYIDDHEFEDGKNGDEEAKQPACPSPWPPSSCRIHTCIFYFLFFANRAHTSLSRANTFSAAKSHPLRVPKHPLGHTPIAKGAATQERALPITPPSSPSSIARNDRRCRIGARHRDWHHSRPHRTPWNTPSSLIVASRSRVWELEVHWQ